jgi:GNAT superfamily N-acetyltransferase
VATTEESGNEGGEFHARDILRRIMAQRVQRYADSGPDLAPIGSARFRKDGTRLLIAYAVVTPGKVDSAVSRVISYTRLHGLRPIWNIISEGTGEEELPNALRARGFTLDERLILMARQGELNAHINVNSAIAISPITTWTAMLAYERGSRRSFYNDPIPEDSLVIARARERWRQQEMGWYRYYAASLDNHLVGGLYVSLWEDVPTLMGVYTLDTARRQGVATTTMASVIHDLTQAGRNAYCLYVKDGNPAERLYHELGFQALATEETYTLDT